MHLLTDHLVVTLRCSLRLVEASFEFVEVALPWTAANGTRIPNNVTPAALENAAVETVVTAISRLSLVRQLACVAYIL